MEHTLLLMVGCSFLRALSSPAMVVVLWFSKGFTLLTQLSSVGTIADLSQEEALGENLPRNQTLLDIGFLQDQHLSTSNLELSASLIYMCVLL